MSKQSSVKRWSAKRKQEVVLRLLRGESLDAPSRETGHPAACQADVEGAAAVGVDLRHRRGTEASTARIQGAVQYALAAPEASLYHPCSGVGCPHSDGGGSVILCNSVSSNSGLYKRILLLQAI